LASHSLTRLTAITTNIIQFVPSKHVKETRSFVAGNLVQVFTEQSHLPKLHLTIH